MFIPAIHPSARLPVCRRYDLPEGNTGVSHCLVIPAGVENISDLLTLRSLWPRETRLPRQSSYCPSKQKRCEHRYNIGNDSVTQFSKRPYYVQQITCSDDCHQPCKRKNLNWKSQIFVGRGDPLGWAETVEKHLPESVTSIRPQDKARGCKVRARYTLKTPLPKRLFNPGHPLDFSTSFQSRLGAIR
ncbi:uncharacterized protein EI90DRAFT_1752845 [Cantharellus anzutake]|uniref:uncharacterized protein n=1 Tax=Cantharellus anzutake TaxID=1750568 RepID=UPI001904DAF3|nr:uncharacterized protein EI90DRAFT_1752845 [Cantharellus anzutake]KAF8341554.1 hypothetical protein EI90DRAFT_1752845 [Cantharellus anzutake]